MRILLILWASMLLAFGGGTLTSSNLTHEEAVAEGFEYQLTAAGTFDSQTVTVKFWNATLGAYSGDTTLTSASPSAKVRATGPRIQFSVAGGSPTIAVQGLRLPAGESAGSVSAETVSTAISAFTDEQAAAGRTGLGLGTAATADREDFATAEQGAIGSEAAVTISADTAGTPSFAYALQRVRSAYIGACIKVRRSSDDAEQDIGFNLDGSLDAVSLLQFCGSGDGLIKTWYDQSGNARHLQQATTTKQPTIVASGVMVTINGQPAATFTAADSQYMQTSAFTMAGATAASVLAAFSPTDATTTSIIFDHGLPYTAGGFGVNVNQFAAGRIELMMASASAATRLINYASGYTAASTNVVSAIIEPGASTNDNRGKMRWNALEVNEAATGTVGTLSTGVFLSDVLTVGAAKTPAGYFDGKITAIACWPEKLTPEELAAVETQGMRACGLATPYEATPSSFEDTRTPTQDLDFLWTNAFASSSWTTRATTLKIHFYGDIYSSYPATAILAIYVDGNFYQTVAGTGQGAYDNVTVFIPAGLKTVKIVAGAQSQPAGVGEPVRGTWPISFAANAPMERVTITQTNRLLVYGDSISIGANSTVPQRDGWTSLLKAAAPYPVGVEGWGFRSLWDDASDGTARAGLVAKIVAWNPAKLWIAIGTNDYGLNRWTAANFGTAYAALLDDLHTALPDMEIYCQTPLSRTTETANVGGSTMPQYRTQITTAVSTRSWATLVDGTAIMTTASLDDGVHPTDAGHVLYANYVKTVLGIP